MSDNVTIDIKVLAEAVRDIDGGCGDCIINFLNDLPYDVSLKISKVINVNNPIYGDESLVFEKGEYCPEGSWTTEE